MSNEKSKLWGASDAYEQYMGRWSRKIAPLFVDWLAPPQGKRWIDIGCGTGQLSLQIANKCNPSHQIGIDTSEEGFLTQAKKLSSALRAPCGDRNGSVLDCARRGAAVRFWWQDPVKKHGPWAVADLRVVTPSGDPG